MSNISIIPELNQLAQFSKPELVALSETPKLREMSLEERKMKTVGLVASLLSLLAVSEGKVEHHNALVLNIADNYTDYTFEEMFKAFNLFVKGDFKTKPFQQLNAVVFGQVMAEYDQLKRNQAKTYQLKLQEFKKESKPMSQKEIDEFMEQTIEKAAEQFQKTGTIEMPGNKYDWLDSKGRLQRDRTKKDWHSYKRTKYTSCKARLKAEIENQKPISKQEKIELKNILQELEESKSGKVVLRAKTEILEDYFKTLLNLKN